MTAHSAFSSRQEAPTCFSRCLTGNSEVTEIKNTLVNRKKKKNGHDPHALCKAASDRLCGPRSVGASVSEEI